MKLKLQPIIKNRGMSLVTFIVGIAIAGIIIAQLTRLAGTAQKSYRYYNELHKVEMLKTLIRMKFDCQKSLDMVANNPDDLKIMYHKNGTLVAPIESIGNEEFQLSDGLYFKIKEYNEITSEIKVDAKVKNSGIDLVLFDDIPLICSS